MGEWTISAFGGGVVGKFTTEDKPAIPAKPPAPSIPGYRTELTPEGEQFIIPGTERNASPRIKQLDLF